eukprot:Sspe_Gene.91972::Locus_63645_Transcript_1_1_Confidence_1.000_Length_1512::g.91972::m.91972/K11816/YUCCA; indole-3-pyruvate monooxygenase
MGRRSLLLLALAGVLWLALPTSLASLLGVCSLAAVLARTLARDIGQPTTPQRRQGSQPRHAGQVLPDPFQGEMIGATTTTTVAIVGAGASGLSVAAELQRHGVSYIVLEKAQCGGSSWLTRYRRLHLHTIRALSEVPHFPFPDFFPEYVNAADLARYHHAVATMLKVVFDCPVLSAEYDGTESQWKVRCCRGGTEHEVRAKCLVVATGQEGTPRVPSWAGMESFAGPVIHSSEYADGSAYRDKRVLVVGFGNSGSEIALDLWESGAHPACLVRSPVHIMPRGLTRVTGYIYSLIPTLIRSGGPGLGDALMMRIAYPLLYGDAEKHGLRLRKDVGPLKLILEKHEAPVQDIGTYSLIRSGDVKIIPHEIDSISKHSVVFKDGTEREFDAIILATGYDKRTVAGSFLPADITKELPNSHGVITSGHEVRSALHRGLYFVGYNDFMGRLFEIALEARAVASDIRQKFA